MGWTLITTVRFNDSDLRKTLDSLRQRYPSAIRRCLHRAADAGQTAIARAMVEDTGLAVGKIKGSMYKEFSSTSAYVKARGRPLPLINFKARGPEPSRGKGRGVTASVGGGRERYPHAFIATMPGGHRGVFERKPNYVAKKRSDGRGWSGLPIREVFGPSIVSFFIKHLPLGAERASEVFNSTLKSEINFALSRR